MDNFEDKFFDIRHHKLRKGQILARFKAIANLVDGEDKRHILGLLKSEGTGVAISNVMRKLCHAVTKDSYRVPREMAQDLVTGLSEQEVLEKPYEYLLEMFYYANPDDVPVDDPHWEKITTLKVSSNILEENVDE